MIRSSRARLVVAGTGIVACALLTCALRKRLANVENPNLAPWTVQVIFGYYLAVFALSVRALARRLRSNAAAAPWQSLLLLGIIACSADLVLNNVQEAVSLKIDASYGPVVLWDTLTFFVLLKVLDMSNVREVGKFLSSWEVATTPLWFLGREILGLPFHGGAKPYIDIVAGNAMICFWYLACLGRGDSSQRSPGKRPTRAFIRLAAFGSTYIAVSALEEVSYIAYRPLRDWIAAAITHAGLPSYATNLIFMGVAALVLGIAVFLNPRHIGDRFGLTTVHRRALPSG
jgi:hypothetical protein